jgi:putative DNA primase/helicase
VNQSRVFLEALFSGKPDELFLLIWTLPEKESKWFRDIDDAVRCAESLAARDAYVGVGFSRRDYGPTRRCECSEIAGLVGVFADIDLRSDAHAKAALPGTVEQALSILPPEFPPTFIILTGNGVHVWWLFKEHYAFENDEDRKRAARLAHRWSTLIRDNARLRGWQGRNQSETSHDSLALRSSL